MDGNKYDITEAACLMILHEKLAEIYELIDYIEVSKSTNKSNKKHYGLLKDIITNAMQETLIISSKIQKIR